MGFGRSPAEFDLPADTDPTAVRIEAYRVWLDALAFGNRPWLVIAAVVGLAGGCLGWAWWRRGHVLGAVAAAGILVLEPLVHASAAVPLLPAYSRSAGNLSIWLVEAAAGVGLIWWMLRRRSASSRPGGSNQEGHSRSGAHDDWVLPRS